MRKALIKNGLLWLSVAGAARELRPQHMLPFFFILKTS